MYNVATLVFVNTCDSYTVYPGHQWVPHTHHMSPPSVHRWGFMIYHFGVEIFKIYTIFKCYFSNISIVPPYRYIYIKDIINTPSFDICVY